MITDYPRRLNQPQDSLETKNLSQLGQSKKTEEGEIPFEIQTALADFESGRKEPQDTECGWPLEAGMVLGLTAQGNEFS